MTAIEILIAAKERLVTKGWTPHFPRCLYMTVDAVVEDPRVWNTIAPDALRALRTVIGDESITAWNDRQTSIETVLAAIDAAVELLRGDHATNG